MTEFEEIPDPPAETATDVPLDIVDDSAHKLAEESARSVPEAVETKSRPAATATGSVSFHRGELGNGMPVFYLRVPGNRLDGAFVVRGGNRHDPVRKEGLVRMMTHAMNTGSQNLDAESIAQLQELLENKFFLFNHGTVETYYTLWKGACQKPDALDYVSLMHDIISQPLFKDIEYAREMVRRERKTAGKSKYEKLVHRKITGAIYGVDELGSAYGIPEDDILDSLTRDDIVAIHHDIYDQQNMCLLLIGDVDFEELFAELFGIFNHKSDAHAPPPRLHAIEPGIPLPREQHFIPQSGKPSGRTEVSLTWVTRRGQTTVASLVRGILMKSLAADFPEDRLVKSYRSPEAETFSIHVKVESRRAPEVKKKLIMVATDRDGILRHLEAAKKKALFEMNMKTGTVENMIDEAARDWVDTGRILTPQERVTALESITPEIVVDFLTNDLRPSHCHVATVDQSL